MLCKKYVFLAVAKLKEFVAWSELPYLTNESLLSHVQMVMV